MMHHYGKCVIPDFFTIKLLQKAGARISHIVAVNNISRIVSTVKMSGLPINSAKTAVTSRLPLLNTSSA